VKKNSQGRLELEPGETLYVEVNKNHPFAARNVGEMLDACGSVEGGLKLCNDEVERWLYDVPPHAVQTVLDYAKQLRDQMILWHTTNKTVRPARCDLTPTSYYIAPPEGCPPVLVIKGERLQRVTLVIDGDKGRQSISALTTNDLDVADHAIDYLWKECSEEKRQAFRFFKSKRGPVKECNRAFEELRSKKRN
jgi:hypothetical protein